MTRSEICKRKALWAERKCNEAAASDKPWALRNLRLYQNYASRFWGEYFTELKLGDIKCKS